VIYRLVVVRRSSGPASFSGRPFLMPSQGYFQYQHSPRTPLLLPLPVLCEQLTSCLLPSSLPYTRC